MRNLLRFIDRYQVLLLFVLLEILSLTLVFSKNRFQSAFFFNSAFLLYPVGVRKPSISQ